MYRVIGLVLLLAMYASSGSSPGRCGKALHAAVEQRAAARAIEVA